MQLYWVLHYVPRCLCMKDLYSHRFESKIVVGEALTTLVSTET